MIVVGDDWQWLWLVNGVDKVVRHKVHGGKDNDDGGDSDDGNGDGADSKMIEQYKTHTEIRYARESDLTIK